MSVGDILTLQNLHSTKMDSCRILESTTTLAGDDDEGERGGFLREGGESFAK